MRNPSARSPISRSPTFRPLSARCSAHPALPLFFCLALGGCVSFAEVQARHDAWRGKDENTLTGRWGAPDKVYENQDGTKVLTYVLERQEVSSSPGFYGSRHFAGSVVRTTYHRCQANFTLDAQGKVVGTLLEGGPHPCDSLVRGTD